MKWIRTFIFISIFLLPAITNAAVDLSNLSAKGVAIYGWHNGVPTKLYEQKAKYLFPVASITKLATAKVAESMYPLTPTFTLSKEAMIDAYEDDSEIVPDMELSRDDMFRALLINSNNAIANQFALSAPNNMFMDSVNAFLHLNNYTTTSFTNPSGLDPLSKKIPPNRLTPDAISHLLSDIYVHDPYLVSIMKEKNTKVTNLKTGVVIDVDTTNKLNRDPLYADKIIISKTGITDLAGQNLAFITSGEGKYDYVSVVFLQSKDRYADGKLIIDWLDPVLHFTVN